MFGTLELMLLTLVWFYVLRALSTHLILLPFRFTGETEKRSRKTSANIYEVCFEILVTILLP